MIKKFSKMGRERIEISEKEYIFSTFLDLKKC
jgi:hypothetical protein